MEKLTLSIIIPCLNEEKYIEKCLSSILNNVYPRERYEIIIVDGESNDRTGEIIDEIKRNYSNIRVLSNPEKIPPVAMNIGIKEAKGDIIMRMDAHTAYPENYISTLLEWKEKLNADNIGAASKADVLVKNKKTIAIKKVLTNKFGVGNGLFRLGVDQPTEVDTVPFGCYRKEVFKKVGYYDRRLKRNQDIELNKRLKRQGMKVFLIPFVVCTYYARETLTKIFKNNYSNGLWNILTVYYTKSHSSLSFRHFVPLFFLLSLILPLLVSVFITEILYIAALSLILYLVVMMGVILKMDRAGTNIFYLVVTFFILHISYGTGSLIGLFHIDKLFVE